MPQALSIAVFPGDGIGPEITAPTVDLLKALQHQNDHYQLHFQELQAGAAHFASTGESLPNASMAAARQADAILLAAMGLPSVRYPDGTEISPQLDLRIELDLYAGVRPVRVVPGQPTPLALNAEQAIDFVLIRESTEGLFASKGQGTVTDDEATETLRITRATSEKLFRFAFDLAKQRHQSGQGPGRVTCVDKANVFRAFAYFRKLFDAEAQNHQDIEADHAYVDATALWMVTQPWNFDVLVTENMFGDILSDLGAGLMGGLGLAPSADIGDANAVFQPCHGSAPDIAGKNIANPMAMVLSAAMLLDWLGHNKNIPAMQHDGQQLRDAVYAVIANGTGTTRDLGGNADTTDAVAAIKRHMNLH